MDSNSARQQHQGQSGSLGAINHLSALKLTAGNNPNPALGSNPLTNSGRNMQSLPPSGRFQSRGDSNSQNFVSPHGSSAAATFQGDISGENLRAGLSSNSRGGKLGQSEQLAQPLHQSRPLHVNTMPTRSTAGLQSNQANEVPTSTQKKQQRKFKDNDSSPGLSFRHSMKNTDNLRQTQKIFSNQSYQGNKARATQVKSSTLSGGPSAQISDMHKKSGSPSKAAKIAHLTYHQSLPIAGAATSHMSNGSEQGIRVTAVVSKKNTSRNSAVMTQPSLGKSMTGIGQQRTEGGQEGSNYPNNNINSIVLQTSPAKFFQGTHANVSSTKKTSGMGLQRFQNQPPPQPDHAASLSQMSNQNAIGSSRQNQNQQQAAPSEKSATLATAIHYAAQQQQSQQHFTLFQPSQQQQLYSGQPHQQKNSTATQDGSSGENRSEVPDSINKNQSLNTLTSVPYSSGHTQQKHYSQVLVNIAQPQVKPAGVPAKTEKTNSMSSLQHSQLSQLIYPEGRGANSAASNIYGNMIGDKPSKTKTGGNGLKSSSGLSLNLNNNNRNSTSPISKLNSITPQGASSIDHTPQTGTNQQLNSSVVSSTKNSTANMRKNFLSSNRLTGQSANASAKYTKEAQNTSHKYQPPSGQAKIRPATFAGNNGQHPNNYQSFSSALNNSGKKKQSPKKDALESTSASGIQPSTYPKLERVLLRRMRRESSHKLHDQAEKQENPVATAARGKLKSNKSNLSLIQAPSSQFLSGSQTQPGSNNNRSVSKRKFNWISPRNSNSSAAGQRSYQNLPHEEVTTLNESLSLSEEIRNVKLDLPNQNVVKADSERARFIGKEHQGSMQQLLTFFCKSDSLAYKQGMNDVIAPFLWLSVQKHQQSQQQAQKSDKSQKSRDASQKKKKNGTTSGHLQTSVDSASSQIDLEEPYVMMREFVATFQANIFIDNDFNALQSCLTLLKLLLKYHDPAVFKHLEMNCVIPEMYSIPWFITYFASRMASAELVLEFWERLMQQKEGTGDPQFVFFFSVALIVYNKKSIFSCDQADLPQKMTQLRIDSHQELLEVIRLADQIEDNTPFSFRQLQEMKSLVVKQTSEGLKDLCTRLEQLTCVPLMPAELFFYAFPGEIDCPDPACVNSLTWRKVRNGELAPLAPVSGRQLPRLQNQSHSHSMIPAKASDSEELGEQSAISSLGGSTNNSIINIGPASRLSSGITGVNRSGGGHPLETESNLNYEQDHQESPIDLINETAKMKHLNSEKDPDSLAQNLGRSTAHYSDELRSNADQVSYAGSISQEPLADGQSATVVQPCARCVQKLHVMNQMEDNRKEDMPKQPSATELGGDEAQTKGGVDSSFEDLSTDILYSKFRLITVDCRLNTLQQEVTLPFCLKFEVLAASRAEQLKNQIKSLLDYKDSYHICLLGLDQNENTSDKLAQTPLEKTDKISIRQFHEYVHRFLVAELINLGFKYISCLPAGFQQVHDLANMYGFQLMDHKDLHQKEQPLALQSDGNIDTPITVSLTSNCYHCLAQKNRQRTQDNQISMVAKKYGSMVNTLDNASFGPQSAASMHLQMIKEKSLPDNLTTTGRDTMGADDRLTDASLQEPTMYQGEKFDLIGFAEYFPFGLKQVYAAANTQLNKILGSPEDEEAKASKPVSSPRRGAGAKHAVHNSSGQAFEEARVNSASNRAAQRGNIRIGGEISRSRYRQININPAAIPRQQSTESAYIGSKGQMLSTGPLNAGMARSAGKSSGSACRKTATYQNQQHLQLQSKYKLMSKVPDFKSQFLGSKDPQSVSQMNEIGDDQELSVGESFVPNRFSQVLNNYRDLSSHKRQSNSEVHRMSSPVRRNRPRINNEVQSQDKDIAQMLQKMQQQKQAGYSQSDPKVLEEKAPFKNVNKTSMPESTDVETPGGPGKDQASTVNGAASSLDKSNIASSYLGSQASESQEADLPQYPPHLESYLLNGIVAQVHMTWIECNQLLSKYASGHIFTAKRLSARKKKFKLCSQLSFNFQVLSNILITPFTVAIIQKTSDQNNGQYPAVRNPQDEALPFAVLQSRFYMYDLIKITSRKSTTKIITFYYRIPKKEEYDETVLEEPNMLQNLNKNPPINYQFAFKRNEFEEVSMSFEFEREEDAKECINSVSSLYKQLKDQQKKGSRRTAGSSAQPKNAPSSSSQPQVSRNSQTATERRPAVKESGGKPM